MESVSCEVKGLNGKKTGSASLPSAVFDAKLSLESVHETVTWQLAKRRSGTHATQTKGDIVGGSRKPWRQKGTGRARAGDYNSPHWVGGAVAHGPQPRAYGGRLSRGVRTSALKTVLTDKFREGKLVLLDQVPADLVKTKAWSSALVGLGIQNTAVVLLGEGELSAARGLRNLPKILPLRLEGVNVYDLLRHDTLVMSEATASALVARLERRGNGGEDE